MDETFKPYRENLGESRGIETVNICSCGGSDKMTYYLYGLYLRSTFIKRVNLTYKDDICVDINSKITIPYTHLIFVGIIPTSYEVSLICGWKYLSHSNYYYLIVVSIATATSFSEVFLPQRKYQYLIAGSIPSPYLYLMQYPYLKGSISTSLLEIALPHPCLKREHRDTYAVWSSKDTRSVQCVILLSEEVSGGVLCRVGLHKSRRHSRRPQGRPCRGRDETPAHQSCTYIYVLSKRTLHGIQSRNLAFFLASTFTSTLFILNDIANRLHSISCIIKCI